MHEKSLYLLNNSNNFLVDFCIQFAGCTASDITTEYMDVKIVLCMWRKLETGVPGVIKNVHKVMVERPAFVVTLTPITIPRTRKIVLNGCIYLI